MAAWGVKPFDNDGASDWAYDLQGAYGLSFVEETLDQALESGEEYLEAPEGEEAIAAAEVVARMKRKWSKQHEYSSQIEAWIESEKIVPTGAILDKAVQAIDLVLSPKSELVEIWRETGELTDWSQAVLEIKHHLLE
ncbi:MAG: DUF4259 domain-containing protein [Anaerolineales bacterium]|nr:DUF4259 domain-containing protein [Anaerolineales bacterium]